MSEKTGNNSQEFTIKFDEDLVTEIEEPIRQVIIFDNNLSTETEDFIELLEFLPLINNPVTIYFNSGGGSYTCGKMLIRELNMKSDFVELVVLDSIDSMAYHVFAGYKGKKSLMCGASAMLHYIRGKREIFPSSFVDNNAEKVFKEGLDDVHQDIANDLKILNDKELKLLLKGQDVHITTKRLAKFFNCEII